VSRDSSGGAPPDDAAGAEPLLRLAFPISFPFLAPLILFHYSFLMRRMALILILLLPACASPMHIVTEGSAKRLPEQTARIAVWGLRPAVTDTVVAWLRSNGFAVMEPAELQQAFDKERIRVHRSFADEQNAVRVAKQLGVTLVVFTQSAIGETVVSSLSTTAGGTPFPGSVPTTFSSASVSLRGVEVSSGELVFSATAKYPQQLTAAGPDTLARLACRALETAWGFDPPGKQTLSPDDDC
jgi:hypothetical protein